MDVVKQKQAARKFVEHWTFRRGSEKGEDQQFWNSLLRDVLGAADVEGCIRYQVPVPMAGTTKFLDAWIPETRVLIEHKSRGIASGSALIVPDATPYHFALFTSRAHNAWMRAVAGRMEMRYQYSKNIVYNNFVAPEPDDQLRARIAAAGETLLAAREPFLKTRTLAQLYNPLAMPPELIKAHHAIDELVEEAYGLKRKSSESKIVAHLFKLYAEKTNTTPNNGD